MIERVGHVREQRRALYLAAVGSLDEWPERIDEPAAHFVLFVAVDARALEAASIDRFADRTLDQGAAYVCVWGPGCERVHDRFDEALARRGAAGGAEDELVLTTWHADDTLDEALWFALFAACPDDRYIETCRAVLAVVVGDEGWAGRAREALADPEALSERVARR